MAFKIDPEFKALNRKLTTLEYTNLAMVIESEGGPRADSIIVALIGGKDKILLDGHNTYDICQSNGYKLPAEKLIPFDDRESALDYMHRLQRSRRNLSVEEMQARRAERIPRVVEARVDGQSLRTIADQEGVPVSTIRRDLEVATVSGSTVTPPDGKIIGKDDREQPAKKPGKAAPIMCGRCQRNVRTGQKAVAGCDQCKQLRPDKKPKSESKPKSEKAAPVDAFGVEIPKRCRDAYADPWLQETIDYLGVLVTEFWQRKLADGLKKRAKHYPFLDAKEFEAGYGQAGHFIDQILDHLKDCRPAGVCPSCAGEGCGDCKMAGLVPRGLHGELKKKAKAAK